ncbi:MAG: hypothetical protein H0T53_11875 [Herpetosiphonaceae bacterium]|nr:hypothetical protein [Herpetosiphonaceae bacterium]
MRFLILSLPALFMCGGVLWVFVSITLLGSRQDGRVKSVRRVFSQMSMVVGAAFILWAIAVIIADIINIAYPLMMVFVGLLLFVQGWMFTKLKAF